MAKTIETLSEILPFIKWGTISKESLGYSRGWIYQRLNGYDGNGNECDFTESQKENLREALRTLSEKIKQAAENL